MELKSICSYLDAYFEVSAFQDASSNGLQVENSETVEKIGLAVDACQEAIHKAVAERCNLLIVHHGLFWGRELRIIDNHFQRIRALIIADMALYAVHLPLDAHPDVGHNICIARHMGLSNLKPFAPYCGRTIGIKGEIASPCPVTELALLLEKKIGCCTGMLEFGPEQVRTIGIIAGSATEADLYKEVKREGIDLFVTGEPKHGAYHLAQEFGLNIFFGGHYTTETFGIKALGRHLEHKLGVPAVFLDTPCTL
jgi:dinuclear metal center YbgI/SA1388 family protein